MGGFDAIAARAFVVFVGAITVAGWILIGIGILIGRMIWG